MSFRLECKKIRRTGLIGAFLCGGIAAAAFPVINTAARPDTFTAMSGSPTAVLMNANYEMTALLFGPVVGGLMGGITDILKFLVKPTGPFFFGFTLNAIFGGVIYGAILYHSPISFKRILAAKAVVAVFVNLLLGTFWLDMMYGQGFIALLPARALKQLFTVPIESIIFFVFVLATVSSYI